VKSQHYRKAKKGEITCEKCGHHTVDHYSKRLRCTCGILQGNHKYAVGKLMTCNDAFEPEPQQGKDSEEEVRG